MSGLFWIKLRVLPVFLLIALSVAACASPAGPSGADKTGPSPAALPSPAERADRSRPSWEMEWDKTLLEAKKEGKVVIVGGFGVAMAREPFIAAMKNKFGIDLDITVGPSPVLYQKIANERRAGLYQSDVWLGGAIDFVSELFPNKVLQPVEPYLILPEVKDAKLWFGGELPVWGGQREAFFSLMNISSFTAINKTLVKPEDITSYSDFLRPNLKGKIAMADPTVSGAGRSWFTMSYKIMGPNFHKEFVKQEPVMTRDFRQMTEWLAASKFAVAIGVDSAGIRRAIRDGFPLYMLPLYKEGAVIGAGGGQAGVFNNLPHPNATKIFINWLLSKEGMLTFSKATGMATRRIDVPTDHLDASMVPDPKKQYVFENQKYIEEDVQLVNVAREIFAPVLNR